MNTHPESAALSAPGPEPRPSGYRASTDGAARPPAIGVSIKHLVAAVAAAWVIAALVYGASRSLPPTYQASGTFRVTVPNQQGINDTVVTAADDLATQYSQLATAQPVVAAAAKALGVPAAGLNGALSASTVAAQNLVQVTASASSPATAASRAQAALTAAVAYIQNINARQSQSYGRSLSSGLDSVNRAITQVTARLNGDTPAQRQSDSALLGSLMTQRQQAVQTITTDTAAGEPTLQVVSPGGGAAIVYPKPALYALIALVLALLVTIRIAYAIGRRGRDLP